MDSPKEKISSAGGVVINSSYEIAICRRFSTDLWVLPKGKIEQGETIEDAAIREVKEETGLIVEIVEFVNSIQYNYYELRNSMHYSKTVYFFLMRWIAGDFINHDEEFDEVVWVPKQKALKYMTFESEVDIVKESFSLADRQSRPE